MGAFLDFKRKLLEFGLESFGLFYGTYEGIVQDNDDPLSRGRLKVSCPGVWGNDNSIDKWVTPRGMFSGKKIGFHAMPEKGDTVWITFRGGKPEYPLWEYGWWTKDQNIELAKKGVYVMATPKGHVWVVDENEETMYFTYKGGQTIELNMDKINLGTLGGSKEPAMLGDTTMDLLKEYTDDLGKLTGISTSTGVTGTIDSSPLWAAFKQKWSTNWTKFKSKRVNLD